MEGEKKSVQVGSVFEAVGAVQKEVSVLDKDEQNPFYKSQYLSLPGLLKILQPVLTKNNLVVMQHPLEDGKLKTVVIHTKTGESVESTIQLPLKDATPQGAGSAITYARRYALMAIFNLAAEDDDGNNASGNYPASASNLRTPPTKAPSPAAPIQVGAGVITTPQINKLLVQLKLLGKDKTWLEGKLNHKLENIRKAQASKLIEQFEEELQKIQNDGLPTVEADGEEDIFGNAENQ